MTYEEAVEFLRPIYSDAEGRCHEAWAAVEAEVERLRAKLDALRKSLEPCPHCDYVESDGGLYRHCDQCQHRIVSLAWELLVLEPDG